MNRRPSSVAAGNDSQTAGRTRVAVHLGHNGRNAVVRLYWCCLALCGASVLLYHQAPVVPRDSGDEPRLRTMPRARPGQNHALPLDGLHQQRNRDRNQRPFNGTSPRGPLTPCPENSRRLVWFLKGPTHKLYEPVYRAFHSRGWSVTRDPSRAHVLWTNQPPPPGPASLPGGIPPKPWQRYNQLAHTHLWDDKDSLAATMKRYFGNDRTGDPEARRGHAFPESYLLHTPGGREAFRQRLREEHGGLDLPWVLKDPTVNEGKGVTVLAPRSPELEGLVARLEREAEPASGGTPNVDGGGGESDRLLVQKYICDEMTYGDRKFDVRVFWMVASVDPLIVFYHTQQNYVRIGHAVYDESNFSNSTRAHLTTHTFGSAETKATWDEFRELVERHVLDPGSRFLGRFDAGSSSNNNDDSERALLLPTIEAIRRDPFGHVQKQMKTILAHLVDAFRNTTFHGQSTATENGFSWHAADMIIDNNLDVYIIEGTDGPGKDEDYDFRIKMHEELLGSMVDILEEVVDRQEEGRPLDVAEMKEKGILGGYEVIYDDGRAFDYRHTRLPHPGCGRSRERPPNRKGGGGAATPAPPTRTVAPATFRALAETNHKAIPRTFWMKSRTRRRCEPAARALRRNGWTPVDRPEEAQLVYLSGGDDLVLPGKELPYEPARWQLVNEFPSQHEFFEREYLKHLDASTVLSYKDSREHDDGGACRPVVHRGRPIRVHAYWLVLSLSPLTVLYRDGYVGMDYSDRHEDEFLAPQPRGLDGKVEGKRVWEGSWTALEHYIHKARGLVVPLPQGAVQNRSPWKNGAATVAVEIRSDPVLHVKNQMKRALVSIAEGFRDHARGEKPAGYRPFALFHADFEVDRDLNVFFRDAYHSYVRGEDHSEVVDLHADLYGSAFRMLEHLNATSNGTLDLPGGKSMGNYEWLIRPSGLRDGLSRAEAATGGVATEDNPRDHDGLSKFTYDWNQKARECFA